MSKRLWLVAAAACLMLPWTAMAQQPTVGTLEVRVVDQDGNSLPGATVTANGPLGETSAITNKDGVATLRPLPVGTYRVRVIMQGFGTIEVPDVGVSAGQRAKLPVALVSGKVETVTVVSTAPLVDPRQMEVVSTFKMSEASESLPIGRNFTDAVAFAPGVVSGLGTGQGNYSVGGSSGLENSYIIDGVNITDGGYGGVGTYSINYGSLGTGITSDFLEEIQVKTAGFEAEYGQALGGVVNGVVRSGTNDLTGSVKAFYTPDSLESNGEDASLPTGATNIHERNEEDFGVSAGGPIVKDRAFWFLAYNPVSTSSTRFIEERTNPILILDPAAATTYTDPTIFPGANSGGRETKRDRDNYAGKFNILANSSHWFELTAFGDPSDGVGSDGITYGTFVMEGDSNGDGILDPAASLTASSFADGAGQSTLDYGADQQSLRYNGLFGGDWFVQAQISHRENDYKETTAINEYRYRDRRAYLEGLFGASSAAGQPLSGGPGFIGPTNDETYDYSLKVSKSFGKHELKFGAQYYDLEYTQVSVYSGPRFTLPFPDGAGGTIDILTNNGALVDVRGGIPDCAACTTSVGNPYYRVTRARIGQDPGPVTSDETSFFVQDTWSVSDRFTINLGVRSTEQELTGSAGFTLPLTRVSSTVFTSDPTTFSAGSYKFDTELSPRIGVSFDPWANGKGKASVHYARYFERVPADLAVRQFSNEVGTSRFEFTDPALTNPRGTSIFMQGLGQTRVENGTKLPYVDEYVVGWEQLIRPDLSFEVRGIYREQGRVLEDVQFASLEAIENFYYYYDNNGNGLIDADGDGDGVNDQIEILFPDVCPAGAQIDPAATPDVLDPCFNVFQEYVLANPGENTAGSFGSPVREYKALEFEITKRMSNNWRLSANYRYSELKGNYEGLYRNDNTQSDPNITSVFDFPDSNIMRGQYAPGPLNTDRPHVMHILGSYVMDNGVELGGGFNWQSGTPRTALLAHPNYQNSGELPGQDPVYCENDGTQFVTASTGFLCSYTDAPRGSIGRLPDVASIDFHAGYTAKFQKDLRLKLTVDVFNIFDTQEATTIDDIVEVTAGIPNAEFNKIRAYQLPRAVRLAANFTW